MGVTQAMDAVAVEVEIAPSTRILQQALCARPTAERQGAGSDWCRKVLASRSNKPRIYGSSVRACRSVRRQLLLPLPSP